MGARVAVVGGGITGLVATLDLIDAGCSVELFERDTRLGGKVGTTELDGLLVPTAADNFLARVPEMIELCHRLGLGHTLHGPAAREPRIFRDGQLHPLPDSLLGIPLDLESLADSGLVSAAGAARAALDLDAPDDRPDGDEAVGALVRRRLGDEVLEFVVDPLLGGINAGDSDRLSVLAGVPQIGAARAADASLVRGARRVRGRAVADPDAPVFLTPDGGMAAVFEALVERVQAGAVVHTGSEVDLRRVGERVTIGNDEFDRAVVTAPAHAGRVVRRLSPAAAEVLDEIEYSSVAMILISMPRGTAGIDPAISGVLVPRSLGLHVTAVSFATNKWPELGRGERDILRVSVGRRTDRRWMACSDDELLRIAYADLDVVLGRSLPEPSDWSVVRWIDALPQYDVGHAERIEALEGHLERDAPSVRLAGAALRGLGLPACVRSAHDAVAATLSSL